MPVLVHVRKNMNIFNFSFNQFYLFKAAGIPDFRSDKTGMYSRLKEFNLPFPEAVFEMDYFKVCLKLKVET